MLKSAAAEEAGKIPVILLGPTDCGKRGGSSRSRIIVKCRNNKAFRELLRQVMSAAYKDKAFEKVSFYADFNGEII